MDKVIMYDDPNLVKHRKDLEGWTGPDGLYYGKGDEGERRARFANCTHKKCDCGGIVSKFRNYCENCSSKKNELAFNNLEEQEWDGVSVMAEWDGCEFFSDMEGIASYCLNNDIDIRDIKIVACEKRVGISEVNIDELNEEYCDEEGSGVSYYHPEIADKVKELNELIKNAEPKLWFPTNKRIKVDSGTINYFLSEYEK